MQGETRQALIGWMREFGLAMAIYIAALVAAIRTVHTVEAGALRTILVMAPILPGLALIGLTVRAYAKCDEYIRQRTLQAAALAAVVVAVLALIYFFLELLGWPPLSMAWVSNVLWAVFVAQMVRLIATGK
ncbi:MAG TPA: hypothetical protein VNV61_03845 [Steroidobacteraceae bacterium]|jgi:hypothetical protein|nr:hypothetical protein [Steroidobacteraceae bacterium]